MEGMMKCGIYYGIGDVRMEERPIPQIGIKDVLVKILRAGICGSDTGAYLHGGESAGIFKGQQFGHEMIGKIVEKGADVADDIQIGDLVFVEPLKASKAGKIKADMTGGFSEYVKVENAKADYNIYVLDKDIDLDAAAIIEPLCVGTHGAVCTNPSLDDHVVILGAGPIGLSAAAALIARGIRNVIVVGRKTWKLDKALELGAKVINTTTDDVAAKLLELCGEAPVEARLDPSSLEPDLLQQIIEFSQKAHLSLDAKKPNIDLVIDCAGALPLLQQCFNMGKAGTKYVIVAVYSNDLVLNSHMFILNQAMVRGSQAYTHETILEVIDHITKEKTPIKTIVTKKFRHMDFPEAIKAAANASENIKVIIDYEL